MATKYVDQQLNSYTATMGAELAPIFLHIKHEFLQISVRWDFACTVQHTEERWSVFESGLGGFAVVIYGDLYRSVISGLMRLLDPKETSVKGGVAKNLSLKRLVECVPAKIKNDVEIQLSELVKSTKQLKLLRDKLLAHNDLDGLLGNHPSPQYPSRLETTEIVKNLLRLLNTIEKQFGFEVFDSYPHPTNGNGHALNLLNRLRIVNYILNKEYESALKSSADMQISRKEFLEQFGYFKESEQEIDRYLLA